MKRRAASCFKGRPSFTPAAASQAGAARAPNGRGAKPQREWRQTQIHANSRQELPIAVLSLFNGLAGLARRAQLATRSPGWAPSEILPKASIERPGASKGFKRPSIGFKKFQFLSPNRGLSMAYRRMKAKKIADRAVGRTGPRAAEARARSPGQSPIPLSPSIPILAFPNRDFVERPQVSNQRPKTSAFVGSCSVAPMQDAHLRGRGADGETSPAMATGVRNAIGRWPDRRSQPKRYSRRHGVWDYGAAAWRLIRPGPTTARPRCGPLAFEAVGDDGPNLVQGLEQERRGDLRVRPRSAP
jgi:hypothetical protein